MEKRVLLAVLLSFVVLYGYQAMFPPPKPPVTPATEEQPAPQAAPQTASPTAPPVAEAPPAEAPASTPAASATAAASAVVSDTAEHDIPFENDSVRAVFTSRGGVLKSWELKHYQGADGKPLELVPVSVPSGSLRPFSLSVGDAATTAAWDRRAETPWRPI